MLYRITKIFNFPVGHRLSKHKGYCKFAHGHTMKVEITISCDELNKNDMVVDFSDLKRNVMVFLKEFDHAFLANERDKEMVKKYEDVFGRAKLFPFDPTAEALATYIFTRLIPIIEDLKDDAQNMLVLDKVVVWESETAKAEYTQ